MKYRPMREITQEEIRTYREDGIVCLRQFFDAEAVKRLRGGGRTRPGEPDPDGQ